MEVVDIKASAIQQATESKVLTRQVVKASPVTERLESVWSRTVQKMDEMTTDNGAPWVNAATKQIELMAKLTGELREKSDINVSISIVSPAPQQARVDYGSDDDGCIDIGLE